MPLVSRDPIIGERKADGRCIQIFCTAEEEIKQKSNSEQYSLVTFVFDASRIARLGIDPFKFYIYSAASAGKAVRIMPCGYVQSMGNQRYRTTGGR
jgi:hypothetical protein